MNKKRIVAMFKEALENGEPYVKIKCRPDCGCTIGIEIKGLIHKWSKVYEKNKKHIFRLSCDESNALEEFWVKRIIHDNRSIQQNSPL